MQALDTEMSALPIRLSLRDPMGEVHRSGNQIFRIVDSAYLPTLDRIEKSPVIQALQNEGKFITARRVPASEWPAILNVLKKSERLEVNKIGAILEHPVVGFASFPHEWAPEMLAHAAALTLEIVSRLADDGLTLKDATPRNILFQNARGLFVDYLSIEAREATSTTWIPFAQFLRNFVLPLLANKHFGMTLESIFLTHRDGLEPEELYALCTPWQRLTPKFLFSVTLPTLLARRQNVRDDNRALYAPIRLGDPEKAEFIYRSTLRQLTRALKRAAPRSRNSVWSSYVSSDFSFTSQEYAAKLEFIRTFMNAQAPKKVLDIGCNIGDFSLAATEARAEVVGVDSDSVVVGRAWRRATDQKVTLLPLFVNFARPSPGLGWNNAELPSFLDRARGKFDAVFMLAVLHHLTITEGIPVGEILTTVSHLTKEWLVIEYIEPGDRAFQTLCRGRDFSFCTPAHFEMHAQKHFQIIQKTRLEHSARWLYVLKKRDGVASNA